MPSGSLQFKGKQMISKIYSMLEIVVSIMPKKQNKTGRGSEGLGAEILEKVVRDGFTEKITF